MAYGQDGLGAAFRVEGGSRFCCTLSLFQVIDGLNDRPEGSPRFSWNGVDLAIKLVSDMLWCGLVNHRTKPE